MRAFAIVVVAIPCLLLAGLTVIAYKITPHRSGGQAVEAPVTTPPEPSPYKLAVSRAEYEWTVVMSWPARDEGSPADCAEAYRRYALPTVLDAGRSTVTLEVVPQSGQKVVLTGVRVRVVSTADAPPAPHHLAHCVNDRRPPVVRAEGREGEVVDAGVAAREVGADGFRQEIAVEQAGTRTATWQVEVDLTLDGVAVTKVLARDSGSRPLVTAPAPNSVAGHVVWCDHAFRAGEAC
ncbi:hypothetical protein [Lentzea sp. NPDC003310]|uniref:hypothetical protein n=1 Tax=Lentzea sp. NPDC003310 TaxID=3154447 RepID=UPI0033BCCB5D